MPLVFPADQSNLCCEKKENIHGNCLYHLVSDLDGTWIPGLGKSSSLRRLEAYLEDRPGITLTFATGRTFESALALMALHIRRQPDHLVTDVGTGLYHRDTKGQWQEDRKYSELIDSRWEPGLREALTREGLPEGLRFQPDVQAQRRLALEVSDPANLIFAAAKLQSMLYRMGFAVDVLTSNLRCIDVLPMDVDKGTAIRFLEEQALIAKPLTRPMIACGDSENDIGLWRLADIAVIMADSPMDLMHSSLREVHRLRTSKPGPEGILECLQNMENTLVAFR